MISLALLKQFSFFSFLDDRESQAISLISRELQLQPGDILFEADSPADALYFLIEGNLPYSIEVDGESTAAERQEYFVSYIHPQEIVGISALIEPYIYSTTLRAECPCRLIAINAHALRALCEIDLHLHVGLLQAVTQAAMDRLTMTRILLAAHVVEVSGRQSA